MRISSDYSVLDDGEGQASPVEMREEVLLERLAAYAVAENRWDGEGDPPEEWLLEQPEVARGECSPNLDRRLATWAQDTDTDEPVDGERTCSCPGSKHDRICLGCGERRCARCQPQTGGADCGRCGGPVWKDGEPRTPARRNPQMRGW